MSHTMSDYNPPKRKPLGKPGVPFSPLTLLEAEFLVLHGWDIRQKLRRHNPPPKIRRHEVSPDFDPDEENLEEILD